MENFDGFKHTEFKSQVLTGSAADYTIPEPLDIASLGPSISIVHSRADQLQVAGAPGNTGVIYVELTGTATTNSLVLRPGDHQVISGVGKGTLSAFAATPGDILEIIALYR
jgi:hypothetical protein